MTEIVETLESNEIEEAPKVKKPLGRPRKPEEEKKKYIPHPRPRKEKPIKEPRVRKVVLDAVVEPREKLKPGRKKGMILKPERYNEDGTYNKKPLDLEYYKQYYQQVLKHSPCTCDICGANLASKQQMIKYQKTQYCRRKAYFQTTPDILAPMSEKCIVECQNVASE